MLTELEIETMNQEVEAYNYISENRQESSTIYVHTPKECAIQILLEAEDWGLIDFQKVLQALEQVINNATQK